jgi:hypothetical protein
VAYITKADVEAVFGVSNVASWANLDPSLERDAPADEQRVADAITWAEEQVEDRFRDGPYVVPFVNGGRTLKNWCATYAGHWLYRSRGLNDEAGGSDRVSRLLAAANAEIDAVLAGMRRWRAQRAEGYTSTGGRPTGPEAA